MQETESGVGLLWLFSTPTCRYVTWKW